MLKLASILILLAGFSVLLGQDSTLTRTEKKELARIFSDGLEPRNMDLGSFLPSPGYYLKEGDRVFILEQEGEVAGYMLGSSAKGRFENFDYVVFYAPDLSVMGVKVTVYRSTHGAAICQKKWLQQFNGYAGGDLAIGKEIDAISGASISAQSMVDDVQRCFVLMTKLKADGYIR